MYGNLVHQFTCKGNNYDPDMEAVELVVDFTLSSRDINLALDLASIQTYVGIGDLEFCELDLHVLALIDLLLHVA
jgi:hypothetical protein